MDIVVIADFIGSLKGTSNSRFLYLADMLAMENEVEVITSDFNHGTKSYFDYEIEKHDYTITMLHEGSYPTNVCLKRFWAHYVWGKSVKKYLQNRRKPDVIYCAIPPLMSAYEAAKYCEKNDIRFVIDVQDLWPEAFQMVFNVPVISNIVFAPFKILADGIYKRADAICAVSDTYCERAKSVNKKVKETTTVFLGTELATFDYNALVNPVLEKKEDELWLGYIGTLGISYDLPLVFEALKIVNNPNLKFMIMGDGPLAERFKEQAKGLNVIFTGRLEYSRMCGMLKACDIVVNPIVGHSAASIINKHGDYAASGLPVINTQESPEYKKLVVDYNMGFNCANGNADEMAEKLKILVADKQLREEMGGNARRCAEEKFDRKGTYDRLENSICQNIKDY